MNTIKFQTVANFIKAMATQNKFSVETSSRLGDGIVLRDNTVFVRKEIPATQSGETSILDVNGLELPGVQSFKGRALNKLNNQVITHIKVGYATNAASGKAGALKYVNDNAGVPAGLQTANVIVEQSGKTVIKMPISDLIKPDKDGRNAYTELSSFALLREDAEFDIKLEFAQGTDLGAEKHYVAVSLKGMGTFEK